MGIKGQIAWNKTKFDDQELMREYAADRGAVRRLAIKYNCSNVAIYQRLRALGVTRRRGGDANLGTQALERNPNWKGGRRLDGAGYVAINLGGREVREHRIVAARALGRELAAGEVVHHKNGDRSDNRPENLEVLPSQADHMREHMTPEEARRRGRLGGWTRRAALKAVEK